MFKRGQVTIFIIFGIVLVLVLFFILNSSRGVVDDVVDDVAYDFDYYLDVCTENSLKSAIVELVSTGFVEDELFVFENNEYGFFIKDSNVFFKSKIDLESSLSNLVNIKLKDCLDNFEHIYETSNVEINNIDSNITLYSESVFLEVSLNTSMTVGQTSILKREATSAFSYPLLRYYDLLNEFIEEQRNSEFFLISLLVETLNQNNINYAITYAGDNVVLVTLSLPNSVGVFNEDLIMRFALS